MALKVWLPLNGNYDNLGTDGRINFYNNTGATINNSGKIGKCYTLDGTDDWIQWNINKNSYGGKPITYCAWVKCRQSVNASGVILDLGADLCMYYKYSNGAVNFGYWRCYSNNGTRAGRGQHTTTTYDATKWHHVAITFNGPINKVYVDGELAQSFNDSAYYTDIWVPLLASNYKYFSVGKSAGDNNWSNIDINDVRIYDDALSAKEIKEISRALVLHYKLDERYNKNLIVNGFGNDGTENWTTSGSSYYSTTEIPPTSMVTGVKASFSNGNSIKEHIEIESTHTYTISAYLKCRTSSTTYIYPSIFPYDIDDKFIYYYNEPEGFWTSTSTTLAQDLNPGDTVIYATNLSQWNTNSGHYGNECSIFNYRDSTGHVYPDFTYTQNIGVFGSSTTEKTNINKTNNTITLRSAYNGQAVRAGTTICQSTEGSTYYYPFGGMALNTLTDWTFKTATLRPQNISRLKYAKYWTFMAYGDCYYAGIKLIDDTINNNIVPDSSGYNNFGRFYFYDNKGTIVPSFDSQRYLVSTYITNADNSTYSAEGTAYIYGNCSLTNPDRMSVAFWCKPMGGYASTTSQGQFCTTNYVYGNTYVGADYQASAMNHRDGTIDINDSTSTTQCRVNINFTAGEWHHYAVTYDGQTGRVYKDGVLTSTNSFSSPTVLDSFIGVVIGFSCAGGVWRSNNSYYSDFRVYATTLSEEDIKELYNNPANIDNLGRVHGFELSENKLNLLNELNLGIATKTWVTGLNTYTQSNCQVTLTDDGLRIYRTPNINPTDDGNVMWGGLRLVNSTNAGNHIYNTKTDNIWGLQKGHSYIWTMHVEGQTTNNPGWILTNQLGWGGGGLQPSPTNNIYCSLGVNFTGSKDVFYKFTVSDDIVKTCTNSYSSFVAGNDYLSYRDFGFYFGYEDTGTLGTDIYITNLKLFDVTDIDNKHLYKNGVLNFSLFDEKDYYIPSIRFDKELLSTGVIEK